jgi:hypothetical protein
MQMLDQFRNSIDAMKNRMIAENPNGFRGYRLTDGKGKRMMEMRTNAQWAVIEEQERIRQAVVTRARAMIEQAHIEYEIAKEAHRGDMKMLTVLTLQWSPERVLSMHREFANLCRALKDEKTWRALSRKERRFIADAVGTK